MRQRHDRRASRRIRDAKRRSRSDWSKWYIREVDKIMRRAFLRGIVGAWNSPLPSLWSENHEA